MVREIIAGFEMDPDVVRRVPHGIDPRWWRDGARDEAAEAIAVMPTIR